jgi:hypothetical protein
MRVFWRATYLALFPQIIKKAAACFKSRKKPEKGQRAKLTIKQYITGGRFF